MKSLVILGLILFSLSLKAEEPTEKSNPSTIAPIVSYSSTYGLILGVGYFKVPKSAASDYLGLQVLGTFEKVFQGVIDYQKFGSGPISWDFNARISNFYDPYYGEGISTSVDSYRKIDNDKFSFRPEVLYAFDLNFSAGLFFDYRRREEKGIDGASAEKLFPNESSLAIGLSAGFDSRDQRMNPTSGALYQLLFRHNPKQWTNTPDSNHFSQLELDLRQFFPVKKSVLGLRIAGGTSSGEPSYLFRYKLGGDSLRGFYTNRFRGKHFYLVQTEARIPLKENRIDGVLFADAGSITDDKFTELRSTAGFGFRFALPPSYTMKVRVDAGFASDQTGVAVAFGEAF